jgi:hypothetical protein
MLIQNVDINLLMAKCPTHNISINKLISKYWFKILMSLLKVCGALNSMGVSINEVILGEEGGV